MSRTASLILASASPRRRELLSRLGVDFDVVPSDVDEVDPDDVADPVEYARELAEAKARDVVARYPQAPVLAADTIVVMDGRILGKPADDDDARRTLQSLRSRGHEVTTGVALANAGGVCIDHATTPVIMRDYTDGEIGDYIASGDPFDKAGSYAIQDRQFQPVGRYDGCYCNVVGLPVVLVYRMLEKSGVAVPRLKDLALPPECRTCPFWEPRDDSGSDR